MDSLTAADFYAAINTLIDFICCVVIVVCFCLGWVAGSVR